MHLSAEAKQTKEKRGSWLNIQINKARATFIALKKMLMLFVLNHWAIHLYYCNKDERISRYGRSSCIDRVDEWSLRWVSMNQRLPSFCPHFDFSWLWVRTVFTRLVSTMSQCFLTHRLACHFQWLSYLVCEFITRLLFDLLSQLRWNTYLLPSHIAVRGAQTIHLTLH